MTDSIYIPDSPSPPMQTTTTHIPESTESYCALCLRERPPGVEFYDCNGATEFQESIKNNVGLELTGDVCSPCWKMVQLMEDFRLCCFKAQDRLELGIKGSDEWFQEEVVHSIENLRSIIQQQVVHIEGDGPVLTEEEHSLPYEEVNGIDANEALVTQISVGDFKIEVFDDEDQDADCNAQLRRTENSSGNNSDEVICVKCGLRLNNNAEFKSHSKYCRLQSRRFQRSELRHKCSICWISFAHHYLLDLHMYRKHGIKSLECNTNCTKSFNSTVAASKRDNGSELVTTCKQCNATLANNKSLRTHMIVVHGQKKFSCEHCSRKFARMYELKRHCRVVHNINLLTPPQTIGDPNSTTVNHLQNYLCCELCSSTFSTSAELVGHRTMVHLDQLSKSSPLSQQQQQQLINLELPQSGKLVHQCPTCKKTFTRYGSLLEHVQRWHSHLVQEFVAARRKLASV